MWVDVVNNVIALGVGLTTGFYFERRSTKAARLEAAEKEASNRELRQTLTNLRAELVSRTPASAPVVRPDAVDATDLSVRALAFARNHQDPSGRLNNATLRTGLAAQGFTLAEVDAAIEALEQDKSLRRDGTQWEVQT